MRKTSRWPALGAMIAMSGPAGATGQDHPLVGYWVYQKDGFMAEYTIERVHEDGRVDGVYCMHTQSKTLWGMRFDGHAQLTRPKVGVEIDSEALWQVATMTRKGTRTTSMRRRRSEDGCLAHINRQTAKLEGFIANHNACASPFVWVATAESIFGKLERLSARICGI